MKKLISILGMSTMGFNSLVIPMQNITNKEEVSLQEKSLIKSNLKTNEQKNITEQWYSKIVATKQEAIFKDNLLSAISLKDNQVNFDLNKIDKKLWNDDSIYNLISNPEYVKTLQSMYKLAKIQFINGKAQFLENSDYYDYSGIWADWRWYWVIYWELHIGHVECQQILQWLNWVEVPMEAIEGLFEMVGGRVAGIADLIGVYVKLNEQILRSFDRENGVWIGILGFIPDVSFGSD